MNRAQPFLDWAFSQPDKVAVRMTDAALTYAELAAGIRAAAHRLRDVVVRGTRVGLQVRNSPQFLAYQNALFYLGGSVTPLNPGLSGAEVGATVDKLGLQVLVTDAGEDPALGLPDVPAGRYLGRAGGGDRRAAGRPGAHRRGADPADVRVHRSAEGCRPDGRQPGCQL